MHCPSVDTFVCNLEDLPVTGGRMFSFGEGQDIFRLLVLRHGEQILGYENRCPHFGIPLAVKDAQLILNPGQSFSCNTHYARFRWKDGYCEIGDCEGETIPAVTLVLRDGKVLFG